MFCKKCGAQNDDDAVFCNVCGSEIGGVADKGVKEEKNINIAEVINDVNSESIIVEPSILPDNVYDIESAPIFFYGVTKKSKVRVADNQIGLDYKPSSKRNTEKNIDISKISNIDISKHFSGYMFVYLFIVAGLAAQYRLVWISLVAIVMIFGTLGRKVTINAGKKYIFYCADEKKVNEIVDDISKRNQFAGKINKNKNGFANLQTIVMILAMVIMVISSCANKKSAEIETVKSIAFTDYGSETIGTLMDSNLKDVKWSSEKKHDDVYYVEATGYWSEYAVEATFSFYCEMKDNNMAQVTLNKIVVDGEEVMEAFYWPLLYDEYK